WSFDALRDAGLLHLDIMKLALEHGMILKDATPYNVQFRSGHPIFIDTLSFQKYDEKVPWIAYRQFCENFLYPLLLEHYRKLYSHQVFAAFPEGIPVDVTARLLPLRSRFNLGCWLHVFLPAAVGKSKNARTSEASGAREAPGASEPSGTSGAPQALGTSGSSFSRQKMNNLINHLYSVISSLKPNDKSEAAWNTYYRETILSQEYLENKRKIFAEFISGLNIRQALDLGANDGYFSRLLCEKGISVIAIDNDAPSINRLFRRSAAESLNILPLIIDITAPSAAIGFANEERAGFLNRIHCDLIIALALIHHLVIGKNIPLEKLALFFSQYAKLLLIEFVPKNDPKVEKMLASREDIFVAYTQENFEKIFSFYFELIKRESIAGTTRIMYLYKKR
ncbi:MAG TPA: class I SAM-dependent methyltransferase, partial [Flavitalea sp.]|nr:class I SAM-dependent methyltransferase [Flavitalea sp.]